MANPVLRETTFTRERNIVESSTGTMTVGGTATKTLILLLLLIAGAAYTWNYYYNAINPASVNKWLWIGLIGGLVTALIISFKPKMAQYLSPIYAVAEGLMIGAFSAIINEQFAATYPNIVIHAVSLTFVTALVMFTVYRSGIIKVNGTFMKIMTIAMISILVFYIGSWILSMFGLNLTMVHNNSLLSIGISAVIVAVAAFSLLIDYDFIIKASEQGAPKYMEWYGAFGLVVTLVWLYLEILKLLAKVSSRD
jgi:Predicted membrane protein